MESKGDIVLMERVFAAEDEDGEDIEEEGPPSRK